MNKIKIPGFNAEASLYTTSTQYHMSGVNEILLAQVVPQLRKVPDPTCHYSCPACLRDPGNREACRRCAECMYGYLS
jgi:hypothetical protein